MRSGDAGERSARLARGGTARTRRTPRRRRTRRAAAARCAARRGRRRRRAGAARARRCARRAPSSVTRHDGEQRELGQAARRHDRVGHLELHRLEVGDALPELVALGARARRTGRSPPRPCRARWRRPSTSAVAPAAATASDEPRAGRASTGTMNGASREPSRVPATVASIRGAVDVDGRRASSRRSACSTSGSAGSTSTTGAPSTRHSVRLERVRAAPPGPPPGTARTAASASSADGERLELEPAERREHVARGGPRARGRPRRAGRGRRRRRRRTRAGRWPELGDVVGEDGVHHEPAARDRVVARPTIMRWISMVPDATVAACA